MDIFDDVPSAHPIIAAKDAGHLKKLGGSVVACFKDFKSFLKGVKRSNVNNNMFFIIVFR